MADIAAQPTNLDKPHDGAPTITIDKTQLDRTIASQKTQVDPTSAAPPAPRSEGASTSMGTTLATLTKMYRAEFEETFDGLRKRALTLQERAPQLLNETQANIEPLKQDFVNTVRALEDVTTPPSTVLELLAWSTVLVAASTVATFASSWILAPIFSLAIGQFGGLALALGAIPAYAHWNIQKAQAANENDVAIRFQLLAVALAEGLLVGFILQNSYLSDAPLAALLLAATTVSYAFAADKVGNNRQSLLGGAVGAGAAVSVALGLLAGQLTLPYLVFTLLFQASTAITLQYVFKNIAAEKTPTYTYQLALLVSSVAVNLLTHLAFGMSGEQYSQYKNSQ